MHKPKARVNLDLAIIQHDKSYHLTLLNRTDTEQGNHPANASTGKHVQFLVFGGLQRAVNSTASTVLLSSSPVSMSTAA